MTDRDRLVDARAGADVATLRRLGEERAAIADWMERAWTEKHGGVPADIAEQVSDHRIVAALALAVAEMQEHGAFVDGGALAWDVSLGSDLACASLNHPTLPAALAILLRKP